MVACIGQLGSLRISRDKLVNLKNTFGYITKSLAFNVTHELIGDKTQFSIPITSRIL